MKNSKTLKIVLAAVLVLVLILLLMQCTGGKTGPDDGTQATETTGAPETTEVPIPSETGTEPAETEEAFTPSVSQKGAPPLRGRLVIRDKVDGIIDLENPEKDRVVCEVPDEKLHMLPFGDRDGAELEDAYREILEAGTLADLSGEMEQAALDSGMDLQKLVVRDLVDIRLDPEYNDVLNLEENYLALSFGLDLKEKLIVMARITEETDGGPESRWDVISGDRIRYLVDGTVTVAFEQLCPVAFVVEGS